MSDNFTSWDDYHRAASGLVSEAYGWGQYVDLDDDEALLDWARHYLPRVIALGSADVTPGGAA